MLRDRLRVELVGTVSSTQDAIRERLDRGEDVDGLVLRAESQSKGRGRFERPWQSDVGGSYQTVAIADPAGNLRSSRVPIAVAVGIAETFRAEGVAVGLKWPNDLYSPQRATVSTTGTVLEDKVLEDTVLEGKLGGILCEHVRKHLLIGVGVNVRNTVSPPAAALDRLAADTVSDLVLSGICAGLERLLQDERLPEIYDRYDLLRGREVRVRDGEHELAGAAAGIDDQGCLLLQQETTRVSTCSGRITRIGIGAMRPPSAH